ncbi:activating transcription factor 7-interacting protein 2 isoform X2 [Denticeps clupeoides]|uniref:Activating transcription factor 7-interacting protein Fn3 domain-containing protein n=1 Tax=Denticeps clupeoides TaxID=299321 RepID=A0AAY4D303_9TELE|nr:activating transcription factor 7-interacting protein 2 isoform X2 [Denticeps clupeoides]
MKRKKQETSNRVDPPPKRRVSKVEIQNLVTQEVLKSTKEQEDALKTAMDRMKEMASQPKFDVRIKQLEAHIKKIKQRGDAAFAYMREMRSGGTLASAEQRNLDSHGSVSSSCTSPADSSSPGAASNCRSVIDERDRCDTKNDISETRKKKSGVRRSRMQVVDLTNEDDMASIPIVHQNGSIPQLAPKNTFEMKKTVKTDKVEVKSENFEISTKPGSPHTVKQEPSPEPIQKTENQDISKGASDPGSDKEKDDWKSRLHPLPDLPFPTELPVIAATKNMPQKMSLKVALLQNPKGIGLVWNVNEQDPHSPEMDCYYIYGAQEGQLGNFSKWTRIGMLKAMPLPMACQLSEYASSNRLCFAIVGKDVYGRYGPYSEIEFIYAVDPAKKT